MSGDLNPNPDTLRVVGELLYGPQWQSALARDLDVSIRTMQRWVAADFDIPVRTWLDLAELCDDRSESLRTIKRELAKLAKLLARAEKAAS